MSERSNLLKVLAVALSMSSIIIASHYVSELLVEKEMIDEDTGTNIVLFVLMGNLIQMIYYAFNKK